MMLVALAALLSVAGVKGIDNGIGRTPPRGWRSWNQFQCNIDQQLVQAQYAAQVSRKRTVGGVPTSLLDLGYATSGIDDCWQKCNSGVGGGFHDANGDPIVDKTLFPDMKAMATRAKSLGLKPGWYGNNCHCREQADQCKPENGQICFEGDVRATLEFGFDSIKLDGCGVEKNMTLFASLFNATGKHVMLENCHNGNPTYPTRNRHTGSVDCPMNFFRSSTDIRPTFGSILINLMSTISYNSQDLTGPGCWAYPDMLEVGVTNSQRVDQGCKYWGQAGCTLNIGEAATHFYAWCIVSAPLVLGNDLTDDTTMDRIWPIISNKEAIAVNQAWVGDSGTLVAKSPYNVSMKNCSWFNDDGCEHPSWMVWKKRLPDKQIAVLLMNNYNDRAANVSVVWQDIGVKCPSTGCAVRDVAAHNDLGYFAGKFTAANLGPHHSAFVIVKGI